MEDKKRGYVGSLDVEGISPKIDKQVVITKGEDNKELVSVGLKLNPEQVIELINLLGLSLKDEHYKEHSWEYLNLTGYRDRNNVTVTYYKPQK